MTHEQVGFPHILKPCPPPNIILSDACVNSPLLSCRGKAGMGVLASVPFVLKIAVDLGVKRLYSFKVAMLTLPIQYIVRLL